MRLTEMDLHLAPVNSRYSHEKKNANARSL